MFWADRIAQEIIKSKKYKPYWVDDMKTPSGRIHVGSLRGVLIHELVWRALTNAHQKAAFTYVFEDHDPMDELPFYLDKNKWSKYLGQPLFTIPSPDGKAENYAKYFAEEFKEVFHKLGCLPKIIWVSDYYKSGQMNNYIRLCLDKTSVIKGIYEKLYKKKIADNWYPFQVVCFNCGKETTTKVTAWDGDKVTFQCIEDAVPYTRGCGIKAEVSPFSDKKRYAGKLPWKVEWGVKWSVIGVTVEGAGKDHMSAGGSHDVAKLICNKVLKYPVPYPIPYEFFLIGGKKMSSSKGLGKSAKEISEILPPYMGRFLFTRTDYREAIEFDPVQTMAIPDLFDEYDRCWHAYNTNADENLGKIFEYSQIDKIPSKKSDLFLPRFRDVANYYQHPTIDLEKKFTEIKGKNLTDGEKNILEERKVYAKIWVERYAPVEYQMSMTADLPEDLNLTPDQKAFIETIPQLNKSSVTPEELQLKLYEQAKSMGNATKDAFTAIYKVMLNKIHGPKAGWLIKQYPQELIARRFEMAVKADIVSPPDSSQIHTINRPELFVIEDNARKNFPSVSIGIAVIRNVNITKSDPALDEEKNQFLISLGELNTEGLGKFPEILSYRKLYKSMGIDWHSRRPSPEALLRRIVLKKGLYSVNTCVDAYNLVVMKRRISVGAFDLDKVQFPAVLRFAGEGDEILLLGDRDATKYSAKELAYYDRIGGYNIDFNYRDAQRTCVTENTKNLWINVDGIYDISPQQVEKSLEEAIELITKYCGGTVEFKGVVI